MIVMHRWVGLQWCGRVARVQPLPHLLDTAVIVRCPIYRQMMNCREAILGKWSLLFAQPVGNIEAKSNETSKNSNLFAVGSLKWAKTGSRSPLLQPRRSKCTVEECQLTRRARL